MKTKKTQINGRVDWVLNDNCNYRCSYCFISNEVKSKGVYSQDIEKYLEKIKKTIPRGWSFYLLGGEPFLHPDFFLIVKKLVEAGYFVSVNTNFSSKLKDIYKFFDIAGNKLKYLVLSLHLEYTEADVFLKKILEIKKKYSQFKNIIVLAVALPEKLNMLKKIAEIYKKHGVDFGLIVYRDKNNNPPIYTKKQGLIIKDINFGLRQDGFMAAREKIFKVKDKLCSAGYNSLVIYPNGSAYRCFPERSNNCGGMGNVLDDTLTLYKKPVKCHQKWCYCNENFKEKFQ